MRYLALIFLFIVGNTAFSQTWERNYGETGADLGFDVVEIESGDIFVCGRNHESSPFLMKVDSTGLEQWVVTSAGSGQYSVLKSYSEDRIIAGGTIGGNVSGSGILSCYNTDGEELWTYNFAETFFLEDIEVENDGSIVVLTNFGGFNNAPELQDGAIFQFDFDGNLLSETALTNTEFKTFTEDLLLTADGGYLTVGSIDLEQNVKPIHVIKRNELYEIEWQFQGDFTYLDSEYFSGSNDIAVELTDSSYFVAYTGYDSGVVDGDNHLHLIALNSEGELLWERTPFYEPDGSGSDSPAFSTNHYNVGGIELIDEETIILSGSVNYNWQSNYGGNLSLIKTDTEGNLFWHKKFNDTNNTYEAGLGVSVANDGGFLSVGFMHTDNNNSFDSRQTYLIKTNEAGCFIKNILNGKLTFDQNENCTSEPDEAALKNWYVTAYKDGATYRDITDSTGHYELNVDNGSYTVFAAPPNQYWSGCEAAFVTPDLSGYDTLTHDFSYQAEIDCPQMHVDIGTPIVRRCFDATYYIDYSNQGTVAAEDAYIEVIFDSALQINSSTPPWTSQFGQTLTFDLGSVDVQEYGEILVDVTVGCDEDGVELGETHCAEARIYPDTICTPADPTWDGSDIVVDADCESDTVRFFIRNIGAGDMQTPQEYIIIEDHIILIQEPFELDAGDELEVPVPTEGIAYRMEAEQSVGHPIGNMPSINVEGCNVTVEDDFLPGFWTAYPEDDVANFISIDCQENSGSYDPNDKQSQPAGYGEDNLIARNTDIEYLIRFQNTGTDTAFTVVIEDELTWLLDITTVVPGASSHPYVFDIEDARKLVFTFNDILLPDSTTNEAASQGFVKFRVSQKPDNQVDRWILNDAQIFFDFNAPITTNETKLIVGRHFYENYVSAIRETKGAKSRVTVTPNPFATETVFTLNRAENTPFDFVLVDVRGQELRRETLRENRFVFERKDLVTGVYFYRIETGSGVFESGKIVLR